MNFKKVKTKSVVNKIGNVLFWGLLVALVFSTDAKSWLLGKMVSAGLFKAEIKDAPLNALAQDDLSFSLYNANGQRVSLSDLKGKVVFINFWATWCPPCRAEMPSLNALYNNLKNNEGFVFLFINEDEDLIKAKAYLQKEGFDLPLYTRTGNISKNIYNGTLPTTLVLNKNGQVVLKKEGLAEYNTPAFMEQLKRLL